MTKTRRIGAIVLAWVAVVTGLHFYMNADWSVFMNERLPLDKRKLNVAYIPVT